jgi:hypothetical protein
MKTLPVGTRRIGRSGYVHVKTANGQRRWPFEHRVVWEAVNGPMPPGSAIHHIDHDKTNNAPANLTLVFSNAEHHRRYHARRPATHGTRLSAALKGKPKSPEHAAKIAAALRGKRKSPEHRAKLSASLLGRSRPDISAALTGKRRDLTPEQRARLADAIAGRRDPTTGRLLPAR